MPHGEEVVTNLIVTWQDIQRMEELPIYQIHGAFDDYPFPYDDAARVLVIAKPRKEFEHKPIVVVMPSGETGSMYSTSGKKVLDWNRYEQGYEMFPAKWFNDKPAPENFSKEVYDVFSHTIHCAVTALRMISAFSLPRIEAQKRDIKRATKGMSRTPETKTDKYYILKLSGRSLDYLPEPQGKCRAGAKHRWHMCRGHYRHLKSGKVIFVKGHYRGDKTLGIVHKDYAL